MIYEKKDDKVFITLERSAILIQPFAIKGEIFRRAFFGVFVEEINDLVKIQVYGICNDLSRACYYKPLIRPMKLAAPKGFLP